MLILCTVEVCTRFPSLLVPCKPVLHWICPLENGTGAPLVVLMTSKTAKCKPCSPLTDPSAAAATLERLQMQGIQEIMHVSLAFSVYNVKDAHIEEYVEVFFLDRRVPVRLTNGGQILPSVLGNTSRSGQTLL